MIDESKLDKLKLISNLVAALSVVVFIVLLGYSASKLRSLNEEIGSRKHQLEELEKKRAGLEAQTRELEDTVKVLEGRKTLLESVIDQFPQESARAYEKAMASRSAFESQGAEEVEPLVYIQISDESQRQRAQALADALQERGYTVPDIENVSKKPGGAPRDTQLRLFPGSDKEDKEQLLRVLEAEGIKAEPRTLPLVARPNQYEIWFGTNDPR